MLPQYRKYKDSGIDWLGKIPAHWATVFLFQVVSVQSIPNKNVHNRNLLSLSYGTIKRKDINSKGGLRPNTFDTYQVVHNGNIILRLTDLQNDHKSIRVGLVTETGIITSAYLCLKPADNVVPQFLYFLLHSYDSKKIFYGMGSGVRQSVGWSEIRRLPIILPPLDEQRAIADYLDALTAKIRRLIELRTRESELLREYKQSLIIEAVTCGLPEQFTPPPS